MGNFLPANRVPLLFLWLALIVTFSVTRIVTARIRKGSTGLRNWSIGGVHVHHQVFGILLMVAAGSLQFAYQGSGPMADVLAALFGVGAALTLDEFALFLRLDDVYWREEGRSSVDAVIIAILVTGLLLSDLTPLGIGDLRAGFNWEVSVIVVINFLCVLVAVYKGKPVIGALGVMVPMIALVAAVRVAKPTSPWARRRYPEGSAKMTRARTRFGPVYQARWNRVRDFIGRMAIVQQTTAVATPSRVPEDSRSPADRPG